MAFGQAVTLFSFAESSAVEMTAHYVLPLNWSLYYARTKTQWRGLRERHKKLVPDWERCPSCPGGCKAKTLDEEWQYDYASHTKTFTGAAFICNGCHWLKSPAMRLKTWAMPPPPFTKPSHLIECLGWTQEMVDARRERDLRRETSDSAALTKLSQKVQQGKATIVPAPIDRLAPGEIEARVQPGQLIVLPWRVDIQRLSVYGYSDDEITTFESRMYDVAAKRIQTLN
jgi:hypothetical protein